MKMGQQVTFFTQKDVQLTFFFYFKYIYRAESTFDKGNIQHEKRNHFREQWDLKTQKFSRNLFSPIELFQCDIFRDEISLIGKAQGGKNQVELKLPALLPLVRTVVIEFRMSYREVFNHGQFNETTMHCRYMKR